MRYKIVIEALALLAASAAAWAQDSKPAAMLPKGRVIEAMRIETPIGVIHLAPHSEIVLRVGREMVDLQKQRVVLRAPEMIRIPLGVVDADGFVQLASKDPDVMKAALNTTHVREASRVIVTKDSIRLE